MYTIQVQIFDADAVGRDVAQPMRIRTVGRVESASAALDYARMWWRHDGVAAVWIRGDERLDAWNPRNSTRNGADLP